MKVYERLIEIVGTMVTDEKISDEDRDILVGMLKAIQLQSSRTTIVCINLDHSDIGCAAIELVSARESPFHEPKVSIVKVSTYEDEMSVRLEGSQVDLGLQNFINYYLYTEVEA